MKLPHCVVAILASASLTGCVTVDRSVGTSPKVELTQLEALPVPNDAYLSRVEPGDQLTVTVANSDPLSGTFLVDRKGNLNFPLIGEVPVAGQFPTDVAKLLSQRLAGKYVRDPSVSVIPSELAEPTVSVGGQVNKPGAFAARNSRSLLRAINNAGGLTKYAKTNDVLVMRKVNGATYIGVFNLVAVQRGNYPDPAIYAGDVVTVGDSPERRQLEYLLGFVPVLTSTSLLIYRLGL